MPVVTEQPARGAWLGQPREIDTSPSPGFIVKATQRENRVFGDI